MYKPETAVRKAAAWFDKKYPGWYRKVSVKKLDMTNSCNCVTGQLRINEDTLPLHVQKATLWADDLIPDSYYDEVQEPWENEIKARRRKAKVAVNA